MICDICKNREATFKIDTCDYCHNEVIVLAITLKEEENANGNRPAEVGENTE